jgi:ribosome-associated protein
MNNYPENEEISDEPLSKTKRKEQMNDLQSLGVELVKTGKEKLAKLNLPDNLLEAIKLAQKITANGAIRRQYQYIGKLMRNVDADAIRSLNGDNRQATRIMHLSEKWRDDLLASDEALDKFIAEFGQFEIGELRNLLRAVRKEREHNQNRNYTTLFRLIKTIIEGALHE